MRMGDGWEFINHCYDRGYDSYQSTRMSSLFKDVYSDETVQYHDTNRVYCMDKNGWEFYNGFISGFIHGLYPIKLPYQPGNPYIVFTEDFLFDPKNGDFDTMELISVTLPDGTVRELNKYYKENNYSWVEISKEEYEERKKLSKWMRSQKL